MQADKNCSVIQLTNSSTWSLTQKLWRDSICPPHMDRHGVPFGCQHIPAQGDDQISCKSLTYLAAFCHILQNKIEGLNSACRKNTLKPAQNNSQLSPPFCARRSLRLSLAGKSLLCQTVYCNMGQEARNGIVHFQVRHCLAVRLKLLCPRGSKQIKLCWLATSPWP